MPDRPNCIDGPLFRRLVEAGARCVEANADAINALNVFPVPDGDTGINMSLTLRTAIDERVPASGTVAEISQAIARGALLGARGNSGVILSQFLKGFAGALSHCAECDGSDLRRAFAAAANAGYQAVGKPVEGTMLTVMRAAAEGAQPVEGPPSSVLRAALDAAERALARTPEQLPVLADAGVVDAGGQGIVAFLAGAVAELEDSEPRLRIDTPARAASAEVVSEAFLAHTADEMYGYCTQFVILGDVLDLDRIRGEVMAIAGSTVVVGDDQVVRVHAHAEDPGPLLSLGLRRGTLDQINIANMDAQHVEFMLRHGYVASERVEIAVVAVAPGAGLERLFLDQGAAITVPGGQTMNPSAADLADATARANAEHVILLPNNSNVIMAANQAAELAECACVVIPSCSVPEGISALLAFNPELDSKTNATNMTSALGQVRSGEVTTAVRSAIIDGVAIAEGQAIALLDGRLACACETPSEALVGMLTGVGLSNGALVTLYYGASRSAGDAEADAHALRTRWPEVEVEVYEGNQPYYHYLVSVE